MTKCVDNRLVRISVLLIWTMTLATMIEASQDIRGYWRMNEGIGTEIKDHSSNGNTMTGKNFAWCQGVNSAGVTMKTDGLISAEHADSLCPTEAITVEAWIKPWQPKYDQYPNIIKKDGSYSFGLLPNKTLGLSLWLNGKKVTCESRNTNWKNGKWQHVAVTYDGSSISIYINGALDKKMAVPNGGGISKSTSDCFIGADNGKHYFIGSIDEVKVEGRALSAREIAQTTLQGNYEIARRENRFTDFYEKNMKRKARAIVPGTLWIEAEDFDDYGGWWMDTQFVPQMGSAYLIAAGIGNPVDNAKTMIEIPESGTYKLWVRNKNWLAEGYAPGKFQVSIGGKKTGIIFGTREQRAWIWQDGGTFELDKGKTTIELEDMTGYYGRCDALILTKDLEFVPRQEQKDYRAERDRFVQAVPAKDMGHYDVVVVGGGVAGCNAAIAAARGDAKVALIQNRPMLGGNNSAEMGVPVSGGSSSGRGRETGLNEEVGRVHAFNYLSKWASGADLVIADEANITVFLNSHVFEAQTDENKRITSVTAFNMIDGHRTRYSGDIFIDCTGDGWLGYYAGAKFMLGRESKEIFGESNAKDISDTITMSGSLMQNSILGYQAIDMGKPIPFDAPEWAYDLRNNAEGYYKRPKFENGYRAGNWWTENHGRNDDLWDPEFARDDLIRVSISYFNWIKNHSNLADKAANYQLKFIPITNAKRETRRLIGDHILIEQDALQRKVFPDRVGYFVWKLDVHHPLGIFSKGSPYDFETNFEPASMPYRILYSKDTPNMFMAGRNVSVSHVALGTARVQGTTGMMGQVVGTAAAMCIKHKTTPRGIYQSHIPELQQQLLKDDMTILHLRNEDINDLALSASVKASSSKSTADGPYNVINGLTRPLDDDMKMWIGKVPNNMWISDPSEKLPQWIMLELHKQKTVNSVYLTFDTNLKTKRYATWQFKQEERMPPECVRDYKVQVKTDAGWKTIADVKNNYQRRRIHRFPALEASKMKVIVTATNGDKSARIYEVRIYHE